MRYVCLLMVSLCFLLGADEPRQDLHHNMEALDRPFKQLRKQVSDSSQNESSLQLVVQMEDLTLACKAQLPRKLENIQTKKELAEETNNYRQMMVNLLRHELDLEEQLINGDNEKAAKTLAEMDQLQKDGHKEFRPERKRRD